MPRDGGTVIAPRVPQSDPHTIGEFEIVAKLGEGGMGAVYKGRQTSLDRFVAIKILPAHFTADPEFIARFKREAKAAAALSHQNIVQAYAAGESNGQHYFAMEFVDGETLLSRIKHKKRIDPIEAVAVCENVAEGLKFAWERAKIIHRDIKPDNIFISNFGDVKLGDLGLAKQTGDQAPTLTTADVSMGTPHYVSPEQVMADKKIDFRADIYSLGCTLFHAVTGRFPYDGDSAMAIMMKHVNEPPPDIRKVWSSCPTPLAQLLDKMLQKDRDKRHQSYEELIADLNRVDGELQKLAEVAKKKAADALKPGPSFGVILGAIGAVCIVVIGLFVWAPWKSKAPPVTQQVASVAQHVAAPTTAATISPSRPAAASEPLEPGAIRLWSSPAEIPKTFAYAWESGAIRLDGHGISKNEFSNRDAVIRADIRMNPSAVNPQVCLRNRYRAGEIGSFYRLVVNAGEGTVILSSVETGAATPLHAWPLPRVYGTDDWARVELRAVGDELTVKMDGKTIGTARDASQPYGGNPMIFAKALGYFRNVVYIPLDKTKGDAVGPSSSPVVDQAFIKEVAALPVEQQVVRVVEKLKQLNPHFDSSTARHTVEEGQVTIFRCDAHGVTDISPVRALANLKTLECQIPRSINVGDNPKERSPLSDLSPLRGLLLEDVALYGTSVSDITPLKGMPLKRLSGIDRLANLEELRGFPLQSLGINANNPPVSNLSPLAGLPLETLSVNNSRVSDLTPLRGMRLQQLTVSDSKVHDLTPLTGLPLVQLHISKTTVADLFPLAGMALTSLDLARTAVTDLSPLRGMPLEWLSISAECAARPENKKVLRSLSSLKTVNEMPAAEFWKQMDAGKVTGATTAADDVFIKEVAALPAEQQVARVVAELKRLNPGFDGKEWHRIEKGAVIGFAFCSSNVTNIAPVRALAKLDDLDCGGPYSTKGPRSPLSDLSPLRGLSLTKFKCFATQVTDLSPLQGMPIRELHCYSTPLKDLTPLQGMPLKWLQSFGTQISDLTPLRSIPDLENLCVDNNPNLQDLTPLAGIRLSELRCKDEIVALPENRNVLKAIPTLKMIGGRTVAEFWKQVDAGKAPGTSAGVGDAFIKEVAALSPEQQVARVIAELKKLNPKYPGKASHRIEDGQVRQLYCEAVGVTNIAPITALTSLRELAVLGTLDWSSGSVNISPLSDLAPLRDMKLTYFECNHALITDLSPLQDMPLTVFNCGGTSVKDLSPLKGASLVDVACHCTAVEDLSPIAGPSLKKINCSQTRVRDLTPLAKTALEEIKCDADTANQPANRTALRQLSSLKKINNLPADEFWKQMDAGKRPKPLSATEVAWQNAINLLPLIDVEMDKVSGKWVAGPSGLVASDITQLAQKMQPPYRPGEEYDYRVSFTPVGGELSVAIGLTAKGRSFALYMKAFPNDNIMGFEAINGKAVASNPTGVHIPKLRTGRQYTVIVQVRKDGLKAYLDGELKTQWKTDYTDLSPWAAVWKFKDDALLGFGCSKTTARFDEVKVIEVTGKGTFTRGNPPAAK